MIVKYIANEKEFDTLEEAEQELYYTGGIIYTRQYIISENQVKHWDYMMDTPVYETLKERVYPDEFYERAPKHFKPAKLIVTFDTEEEMNALNTWDLYENMDIMINSEVYKIADYLGQTIEVELSANFDVAFQNVPVRSVKEGKNKIRFEYVSGAPVDLPFVITEGYNDRKGTNVSYIQTHTDDLRMTIREDIVQSVTEDIICKVTLGTHYEFDCEVRNCGTGEKLVLYRGEEDNPEFYEEYDFDDGNDFNIDFCLGDKVKWTQEVGYYATYFVGFVDSSSRDSLYIFKNEDGVIKAEADDDDGMIYTIVEDTTHTGKIRGYGEVDMD